MIQNMRKCISFPPGIKYRQLNMKKPDVKSNFNGNFKFLYHFSRKHRLSKKLIPKIIEREERFDAGITI